MLATSVSHTQLPSEPLSQAFFARPQCFGAANASPTGRLNTLPLEAQAAAEADLDDADEVPEWTEEDVVYLHWRLLLELRRLADPETPLEEKLDTLAWALTDPSLDTQPFSFASCLRVVGTSPMSPNPLLRPDPGRRDQGMAAGQRPYMDQRHPRALTPSGSRH